LAKKRIVKDYDTLPEDIIKAVKLKYPTGYEQHLVTYADKVGKIVSALPFETDEIYYLIRMTIQEAKRLMKESEDDLDDDSSPGASLRAEVPDMDLDSEYDGQDADDDDLNDDGSDDESDHIIVTRRRDDDDANDIADDSDY
jgi:hypothetical protein